LRPETAGNGASALPASFTVRDDLSAPRSRPIQPLPRWDSSSRKRRPTHGWATSSCDTARPSPSQPTLH